MNTQLYNTPLENKMSFATTTVQLHRGNNRLIPPQKHADPVQADAYVGETIFPLVRRLRSLNSVILTFLDYEDGVDEQVMRHICVAAVLVENLYVDMIMARLTLESRSGEPYRTVWEDRVKQSKSLYQHIVDKFEILDRVAQVYSGHDLISLLPAIYGVLVSLSLEILYADDLVDLQRGLFRVVDQILVSYVTS